MITQVFLSEVQGTQSGVVLGFGTHSSMTEARTHRVTEAKLSNQIFRVVVDELLLGNSLEEVACRARTGCVVENDGFSRIPVGATPDDVANCIVPNDLLETTCVGEHAMCLSAEGVPCGILDETPEDAGIDALRFIDGQVALLCTDDDASTPDFTIAMDQSKSYWQPSGNQQVPPRVEANGVLGPAIILVPDSGATVAQAKSLLPSSQTCSLVFADDVTDKHLNRICAPPNGDITQDCPGDGDVSAFSFDTAGMTVTNSSPADGSEGVAPNGFVLAYFNTVPGLASTIEVRTAGGTVVDPSTYSFAVSQEQSAISIGFTANPLQADTEYVIDLSDVVDYYGVPLASSTEISFTTGSL